MHPHVFRSPLSRHREIVEYQVRQTAAGAAVAVVTCAPCDTAALAAEIGAGLRTVGPPEAEVTVTVVDRLPRPRRESSPGSCPPTAADGSHTYRGRYTSAR